MTHKPSNRASSIPVEEIDPREGMYRFFLAGDRVRAVDLASEILSRSPEDAVAASVVAQCMTPPGFEMEGDSVPEMLIPMTQRGAGELDPRAALLVLSRIDGVAALDEVLDGAGVARADALRIIEDLAWRGVLRFRNR